MKTITTCAGALVLTWLTAASTAQADAAQAKALFKAMSDNLASQQSISVVYDSMLEIVTKDNQKLGLSSSSKLVLSRPDKLRITRTGGFASVSVYFDGKTVSLNEKESKKYAEAQFSGTIDSLIDTLRDKYDRPVPAGDLIMSNVYDQLMPSVTDIKDLGSGVMHGIECDHIALRTKDVDLQLWISQDKKPRPCRYSVTSHSMKGAPSYTIDVISWTANPTVLHEVFSFSPSKEQKQVAPKDLLNFDELPAVFRVKQP